MKKVQKSSMFLLATLLFGVVLLPITASADRCLVVYPEALSIYHYDVNEYYTVTYGDPLYDAMYDRGGEVLIDSNSNEIAWDIYQAPNLAGFEPSMNGQEGYFTIGNQFNLIVDGFYRQPTTYENIILVFESDPNWCSPVMSVNGVPVAGNTYAIGDLTVSTPTPYGNNYSDIMALDFSWAGCYGVRIWAYADENYNGVL
ncbi:MAG: hypothetical protein HY770_04925, partial [Chitinivibrionia bacterium]|nr:hypothetical protein [Chitinivibrionia bacterium]